MASGKQLSFQHGEVSPSLRFRSDAVSYSSGLGKLKNMYVRRTGGVSNRPGFEYMRTCTSQLSIPSPGQNAGIRGFTFWNPINEQWDTLEYSNWSNDDFGGGFPTYGFKYNNGSEQKYLGSKQILTPTPEKARFTVVKEGVFVTPQMHSISGNSNVFFPFSNGTLDYTFGSKSANSISATITWQMITTSGTVGAAPPYWPVVYAVTFTMADGTERFLKNIFTVGGTYDGTGTIYLPNSGFSNVFTASITTGTEEANIRYVNYYRCAGTPSAGTGNSEYLKLAGRIPYAPGSGFSRFTDFGVDDPSITPPFDGYGILSPRLNDLSSLTPTLKGAENACYYQQRLFLGMKPNTSSSIKSGDMLASRVGAPGQISAPIVYSTTGAFQFSIPITDGTPVIASLAMERMIAFTQRGAYVIRGGQQGEVTPSTVNPMLISEEGCSKVVEPMMTGRHGYYVNAAHTKLMCIEFGIDGNLAVSEASIFSNHMLAEDITQLVVLGAGEENTVFLLRRDGKLVQITSADGIHGFSLIETGGYIESVYRGKAKRRYSANYTAETARDIYYDVLMAYIIRNGVRTVERLSVRNDVDRMGEGFADAAIHFGTRLSLSSAGYTQLYSTSATPYADFTDLGPKPINLSGAAWTAGATLTLKCTTLTGTSVGDRIHTYYTNDDGSEGILACAVDSTETFIGGTYQYQLTCHLLQDAPHFIRSIKDQTGTVLTAPGAPASGTGVNGDFYIDSVTKLVYGPKASGAWGTGQTLVGPKLKSTTALERTKFQTRWLPARSSLTFTPFGSYAAVVGLDKGPVAMAIFADGEVVSSPLNPHKSSVTAALNGGGDVVVDFGGPYYAWGYIGLPYTSEFETLDLESQDNRTLTDSQKIINAVGVGLLETRGGFYGMPDQDLTNMEEKAYREEESFAVQTPNFNGYISVPVPAEYNRTGRVNIKQVDPAPITILAVYPKGISGD